MSTYTLNQLYIHDIKHIYNWRQRREYLACSLLLPLKTIILLLFDKNIFVNCKFFVCTLDSAVAFNSAYGSGQCWRREGGRDRTEGLPSILDVQNPQLYGFPANKLYFTRFFHQTAYQLYKYPKRKNM